MRSAAQMLQRRQERDALESAPGGLPPSRAALAFLVTFAVASAPLWFATYPPLHDYPFHLARVDILSRLQTSAALQRWYELGSVLLPNLGMDLVMSLLARVFPIAIAGRVFVALTLAALLSGTAALHRSLFGRWALWPMVSALVLFNWILLYGFLNYLLGVAVLLWATAAWVALAASTTTKRMLTGTCFSVVMFFCHFVALVLFAIVVAGYQLQAATRIVRADRRSAARELFLGAAIFVAPLALFVLSPTAGEAGSTLAYAHPFLALKLLAMWRTSMAGNWPLDGLLSAAAVSGLLLIRRDGEFRIARAMRPVLALLVLAFLATPERLFGARHVDLRMPVAIVFVAIASMDPVFRSRRLRGFASAAIVVLLLLRSMVLGYTWREYDAVIARFTRSFAALPEGAVLFVASEAPIPTIQDLDLSLWQPPLKHVASLASIGREVFVPATWARAAQQPITVTKRFSPMYDLQAENPIPVESDKVLGYLVGRIRRLAADAGESEAPLFLLVLYPQLRNLETPAHADVMDSDPMFTLLAINPPARP